MLNITFANCQESVEEETYYKKGKIKLEIVPFKLSLNPGIYRSRLGADTPFNQLGGFMQLYFPFQRSLDKLEKFKKVKKDSTYYGRLFSVRPLALFHVTNKGGNGLGLGIEFSFRAKKRFFIKPQLGIVWVEANSAVDDGLMRGLNFHHYWPVSYCINQRIAVSLGFNHISNGNFLSSKPTSNYDMITTGFSYTFR